MAFEWNRIHKWEDNIESQVTDSVYDYVMEYYGVDDIEELTDDQIEEIDAFRTDELNEYSPMQWGFSNLLSTLEDIQYQRDNEESN